MVKTIIINDETKELLDRTKKLVGAKNWDSFFEAVCLLVERHMGDSDGKLQKEDAEKEKKDEKTEREEVGENAL